MNEQAQEENIRQAFGIQDEAPDTQDQAEQEDLPLEEAVDEPVAESEAEEGNDLLADIPEADRKYARGWNPDGPKSLEDFVEKGKMIEQIQSLKGQVQRQQTDFQNRINGLTKLQEASINQMEAEYEQKLRDAVNMSDYQGVKEAQQQIDNLQAAKAEMQSQPQEPVDYPDEARAWDEANPWIKENTAKAQYAREIFGSAMQENGGNIVEALAAVDKAVGNVSQPVSQPEQPRVAKTMPSQAMPGRRSASGRLTEKDLSREEANLLQFMRTQPGFDEKQFFTSVADQRSAK
jgi:chromatin segregation and condensation protein Rec8/ScpA/Scc1 (kleisin family)